MDRVWCDEMTEAHRPPARGLATSAMWSCLASLGGFGPGIQKIFLTHSHVSLAIPRKFVVCNVRAACEVYGDTSEIRKTHYHLEIRLETPLKVLWNPLSSLELQETFESFVSWNPLKPFLNFLKPPEIINC